jgi:hypothetical protein
LAAEVEIVCPAFNHLFNHLALLAVQDNQDDAEKVNMRLMEDGSALAAVLVVVA